MSERGNLKESRQNLPGDGISIVKKLETLIHYSNREEEEEEERGRKYSGILSVEGEQMEPNGYRRL